MLHGEVVVIFFYPTGFGFAGVGANEVDARSCRLSIPSEGLHRWWLKDFGGNLNLRQWSMSMMMVLESVFLLNGGVVEECFLYALW